MAKKWLTWKNVLIGGGIGLLVYFVIHRGEKLRL